MYQLPPPIDDDQFERLVRDIARRVYDDPGIERFGRKGQSQSGIDGFSPANSTTFQCKLKDTRYETDARIRAVLMKEMEEELAKTSGLSRPLTRFVFASTFKNDTHLQEKAASLTTETLTVEYWGWDTVSERLWEYADELIPAYYPQIPVSAIRGFKQVTPRQIESHRIADRDQLNKLALDYYRIDDRADVVFQVVCNGIDVRNDGVMETIYRRLEALIPNGTLWLVGDGGSGKTTILHRAAVELSERGYNLFTLNLETHLSNANVETILSTIKFCSTSEQIVLCIDNPAADEAALERILREIPDYSSNVQIILSERVHRYYTLRSMGVLTYLPGEEEQAKPVFVRNPSRQREDVYNRLFELLDVSGEDKDSLWDIVRNEKLVYVNATYSILLELKKKRRIAFHFDWDDYRYTAREIPAYSEGYKYIALFYLFGVRTPFSTFSRLCGSDDAQQRLFLEKFRGEVNEPIIVDEWRDESFRKTTHLRTKHEIVSEIFFREHNEINKDELLMEWCEQTDFANPLEAQALINIFGAKKNFLVETSQINLERIIEFLLSGYLREKVTRSPKLLGTLNLAKFWLLMLRDKSDDATAALEAFIKTTPEDLHSRTELARAYQRQGRLDDAEALLLQILEERPSDLNSRTELAKIYQRQNKLTNAESVLLKLLEIDENNIRGLTEIGKVYRLQNRLSDGERVLLKVLQRKQRDLNARTELSKIYQLQNKLAEAEAVLMELLRLEPDDLQARTELAKIYQRQNKLDEAERLLLESLDIDDKQLHPRTELAKIYQRQGKLAEAETILLELLRLEPNDLQARTELAKIYQRQGKLDHAVRVLEDELRLAPEALHPRTELAKIYQRQGKLDEAERLLMESLEIDDKQLHPRTELAKIYQRQDKLDDAVQVLEDELRLAPEALHPRTELAKIYQRQGKLDEAERLLMESLEIDDKQLHPRTELAKIYQRQGKLDDAVQVLEDELRLAPEALHPRTELAKIFQRQGKLAEAEDILLELLRLEPDDLQARTELAKIYQRQGKLDEAATRVEEVLALDPLNDFAMSELLGTWNRQGNRERCKKRFLAFIAQPNYKFSRYSQAPVFRFFQCCRKFGMKEEAKSVFERFQAQLDDRNIDFYKSTFRDS
jgi:Flp pilus assembly protein TadD